MRRTPLVSIIINNYNYGRFLKEAIDSALAQTYRKIEIIVVDDGSTDNSRNILAEYKDKVIPLLKTNGGQASAYNAGFKVSKGDIVMYLDSDDYLFPTAAEKAVRMFDSSEIIKVHWPLFEIDAAGVKNGNLEPSEKLSEGNFKENAIQHGPANGCIQSPSSGNAWSRTFLNKIFPIPEDEYRAGADICLMVLAQIYGKMRVIEEPLGCYRLHGDNLTLKPFDVHMNTAVIRHENNCKIVSKHLNEMCIKIDHLNWKRDSWFHKLDLSIKEIKSVIPQSATYILANEEHWKGNLIIGGRKPIPFTEFNGKYNGQPVNDEAAIVEIETQRQKGAAAIIFAWTAFWLLDYFKEMYEYLKSKYPCVLDNDRLIAFDLKEKKINHY